MMSRNSYGYWNDRYPDTSCNSYGYWNDRYPDTNTYSSGIIKGVNYIY